MSSLVFAIYAVVNQISLFFFIYIFFFSNFYGKFGWKNLKASASKMISCNPLMPTFQKEERWAKMSISK